MKKLVLSLLVAIVSLTAIGQVREQVSLPTITAMKTYTGGAQYVFVLDSATGGGFYLYNGVLNADESTIYAGALSKKWRRQLSIGVPGRITGLIGAGTNISITGSGNPGDPYIINSGDVTNISSIAITASDLKGLSNPSTTQPYYILDNNQEGFFYYDATDVSTADNGGATTNSGTVIVNTATNRRYKRVYDGRLNAFWFGAKDDWVATNTGTDNTPVLNRLMSVAVDGQVMWWPQTPRGYRFATKPNDWTSSKTYNLLIEGNTYHNNTTFIRVFNSTSRLHKIVHTGTMFGVENLPSHDKTSYDNKTVGTLDAPTGTNWASLSGYAFELADASKVDIKVNFVEGFAAAFRFSGGNVGVAKPSGGQENRIEFKWLRKNRFGILFQSIDGSSYNDKNHIYGGRISGDTCIFFDGNMAVSSFTASGKTGAFRANVFHNVLIEYANHGIIVTGDASYNSWIACKIEGGDVTGVFGPNKIWISPGTSTTYSGGITDRPRDNSFISLETFGAKWFDTHQNLGYNTTISNTPLTSDPGGFTLGNLGIGGANANRMTVIGGTPLSSGAVPQIPAWLDVITLGSNNVGNPRSTVFAWVKIDGVERRVGYKGTYLNIPSSNTNATIDLPVNIGYVKLSHNMNKTLRIDTGDIATSGESFYLDLLTAATTNTVTFTNKSTGTTLIQPTSFTTAGLYKITYTSDAGYRVYKIDGTGGGTTLPSQTGNAGRFLRTDGTNLSWADVTGGTAQNITLAGLRALTGGSTTVPYYVTDQGKEGYWYYAATVANNSTDNTGTIIVTADLKQYKRSYHGALQGRWFGMVADNVTDNTAAMNLMLNAAASNQLCLVDNYEGGTTYYFASTVNIGTNPSTKRYNITINANTRFASGVDGFVMRGNHNKLIHKGIHTGGNSGGVSPSTYASYTGRGFLIKNAEHAHLDVNEVTAWGAGIELAGDTAVSAPTTPYGVQYSQVRYHRIWGNKVQIRLATYGLANTNGNWVNENTFYGGQLGNGFSGIGGYIGVEFDKTASSNQGDPFNGNTFYETGLEGLSFGIIGEHMKDNQFISGRVEGGSIDSQVVKLTVNGLGDPATQGVAGDAVGTVFSNWNYFDEKWNVPGQFGVRTMIQGRLYTEFTGTSGGNLLGDFGSVESYSSGRILSIAGKYGLSAFTIDTLNPTDIISFTGIASPNGIPQRHAMVYRLNNKLRFVPFKGQYLYISSTNALDTITAPPNVGYIRMQHTGTKVIKLDINDFAYGDGFVVDMVSAGSIKFIRADNNTTLINSGVITGSGTKWQNVWSEDAFRTWRTDGTGTSTSITMGNVTNTGNAQGATIVNNVLSLNVATQSTPGLMSETIQTFGGAKTFTDNLGVTKTSTVAINLSTTSATGTDYSEVSVTSVNAGAQLRVTGIDAVLELGRSTTSDAAAVAFSNSKTWNTSRQWVLGMDNSGANSNFSLNTGAGTSALMFFTNTNAFLGASPVDNGFKFEVNGTARINNKLTLGTGAAGIAPLQIKPHTVIASPTVADDGSIQYDGTNLSIMIGATRTNIATTVNTMTMTNKTMSTNSNWNGNVVQILYGGTGASTKLGAQYNIFPDTTGNAGRFIRFTGTGWELADAGTVSSATNLSFTRDSDELFLNSSTGTDVILPVATTSLAGLMSGADKLDLNGKSDSTVILQDSILVEYNNGLERYRDTIRTSGSGTGSIALRNLGGTNSTTIKQQAYLVGGDDLRIAKLIAGTNITLTQNADSSITITGGSSSTGGITTIGAPVTTGTNITNGAILSGTNNNTIQLAIADADNPGMITTGTQTIGSTTSHTKTWNGTMKLRAHTASNGTEPLIWQSSTQLMTTPVYGAMQFQFDALWITTHSTNLVTEKVLTDQNVAIITNKTWQGNAIGSFYGGTGFTDVDLQNSTNYNKVLRVKADGSGWELGPVGAVNTIYTADGTISSVRTVSHSSTLKFNGSGEFQKFGGIIRYSASSASTIPIGTAGLAIGATSATGSGLIQGTEMGSSGWVEGPLTLDGTSINFIAPATTDYSFTVNSTLTSNSITALNGQTTVEAFGGRVQNVSGSGGTVALNNVNLGKVYTIVLQQLTTNTTLLLNGGFVGRIVVVKNQNSSSTAKWLIDGSVPVKDYADNNITQFENDAVYTLQYDGQVNQQHWHVISIYKAP
jgi:hypothetical protein